MAELQDLANLDYVARINRAVDYITSNSRRLVSPRRPDAGGLLLTYHFHRIFRALMGETLAAFVRRVRLETRALSAVPS